MFSSFAEDMEDLMDLDFDELSKIKVMVASGSRALSLKESPGIVSVVTRQQLLKSGVKDLEGALRMIPGVNVTSNTYGVKGGVAIRGLAGYDGKVLMLLDGIELNERAYGTVYLGNRIPIELIERIEVIRGPGSALYGGFAELGVINIITRKKTDFQKNELHVKTGVTSRKQFARGDISMLLGGQGEMTYSTFVRMSHSHPGEKDYTDTQGVSYDRSDDTQNVATAYAHLMNDKLEMNFFYDEIRLDERVGYGFTFSEPYEVRWRTFAGQAKYQEEIAENLIFSPTLSYKYQYSWATKNNESLGYYGPYVNSTVGSFPNKMHMHNLYTDFKFDYYADSVTYTFGWKPEVDFAQISESKDYTRGDGFDDEMVFKDGSKNNEIYNNAFYAQALWQNPIVNVTLGGRYELNSEYGGAFAPRLALTRDFEDFYLKFLASRAFRPPTTANVLFNELPRNKVDYGDVGEIDAETATIFEFELGVDLTENTQFIVTLFDMKIDDPITFYYDGYSTFNTYLNSNDTGSRGVELQLNTHGDGWYSKMFYSYYEATDRSDQTASESEAHLFIGVPQHVIGWEGGLALSKNIHWSLSAQWRSKVIGFGDLDLATGKAQEEEIDPTFFLNTWLRFENVMSEDMSLGMGIDNIFDERDEVAYGSDGFNNPVPQLGRTFRIELEYRF
jgi:outer membrane receptor for ferrienterochelin and colicin